MIKPWKRQAFPASKNTACVGIHVKKKGVLEDEFRDARYCPMTFFRALRVRKFCQTSQHLPGRCLSNDGGKGVAATGS